MKAFMIIRDDGKYIEQRQDNGKTHYEAGDRLPPRLWFKEQQANSWLTIYCKGSLVPQYSYSTDYWGGEEKTKVGLKPLADTARDRTRFRVVQLDIKQVSA